MSKPNNRGQILIWIIVILLVVGAVGFVFYRYILSKNPKIGEISTEEENFYTPSSSVPPSTSIIPTPSPSPTPKAICKDECSSKESRKCSDISNGYQICGNYDADNCLEWGKAVECPTDNVCQNGICTTKKCADNALFDQCSSNKPMYCNDNGSLVYKCSRCGCSSNYICQSDETCVQCIEGSCCNIENKKFRASSYKCKEGVGLEYGCPWGYAPGSDVGIRYQNKYCSGSSADCNGSLKWDEWTINKDCPITQTCLKNICVPYVEFTLTVSNSGTGTGTVKSSPAGIDCGTNCLKSFASGTSITLTATSDSNSIFTGWSGACSGTTTCKITMDFDKSVTANFSTGYSLSINKTGAGSGTITSSPSGINCGKDCLKSFVAGTLVTLSATADSGSIFSEWTGPCTGNDKCVLIMNENKSLTAAFNYSEVIKYNLSLSKSGTGSGTVTSSPSGINCGTDCTESIATWTAVTLTASPSSNSTFAGWTGACTGTNKCSLIMESNKYVVAIFNTKTTITNYTLSVSKSGSGSGIVTSSPTGINCGSDCSELYQSGTSVNLYTTALGGSVFGGWEGSCTGNETMCTLNINGNKSVKAIFNNP